MGGLNSRIDMTQGRISELEHRSIESIQSEQQREKMTLWDNSKKSSLQPWEFQRRKRKNTVHTEKKKKLNM